MFIYYLSNIHWWWMFWLFLIALLARLLALRLRRILPQPERQGALYHYCFFLLLQPHNQHILTGVNQSIKSSTFTNRFLCVVMKYSWDEVFDLCFIYVNLVLIFRCENIGKSKINKHGIGICAHDQLVDSADSCFRTGVWRVAMKFV